jgi:hypothetical protein
MIFIPKKDYSTNLLANYKFEETSGSICIDSKNTYNGTYYGTNSIAGTSGNSRNFNGISDYIQFNDKVIPVGKKSIKFKIKTSSNVSGAIYNIFDTTNDTSLNKGFCCFMYNNKIKISIFNATGSYNSIMTNSIVNDNNWHTIIF